jgi:hypothetical protein
MSLTSLALFSMSAKALQRMTFFKPKAALKRQTRIIMAKTKFRPLHDRVVVKR